MGTWMNDPNTSEKILKRENERLYRVIDEKIDDIGQLLVAHRNTERELRDAHRTIAAIVASQGGKVIVPPNIIVKDYELVVHRMETWPGAVMFKTREINGAPPAAS